MKKAILIVVGTFILQLVFSSPFQERFKSRIPPPQQYDSAITYVHGESLVRQHFDGRGVKVGIIDVGFKNADTHPALQDVFKEGRVVAVRDFVNPQRKDAFYEQQEKGDNHGTAVFKYIAGRDSFQQYGLATGASFYLARTDNGAKDFRAEEKYFSEALEWLHSQGVKLVNVSIGYNYGFEDPRENYLPSEMDGKTSFISQVAQKYVDEYGMIIVKSAGNDGSTPWRIITLPADAPSVISVGIIDKRKCKVGSSSEGPDFLQYVKPNVSCFNTIPGTSFAAPVITGMVACMLQKQPSLKPREVIDLLERTGHLYPYTNNYLGAGVPDASRVLAMMDNKEQRSPKQVREISVKENQSLINSTERQAVLYHKKDKWVVLREQPVSAESGVFRIVRPDSIAREKLVVVDKANLKVHVEAKKEIVSRTTLVTDKEMVEIIWQ